MSTIHHLAAARKQAQRTTVEKLRAAMVAIQDDIARSSDAIYSGGKITITTVCGVAGVSRETIKAAHHRAIRTDIKVWIEKVKAAAPVLKLDTIRVQRQAAKEMQSVLTALAADVSVYRLRSSEAEDRVATQAATIQKLHDEISRLRKAAADASAGGNIVPGPFGRRS